MTDLIPRTALGAEMPRSATFGALALAERPDIALASLAQRRDATVPAPLGMALPEPGALTVAGELAAFWTAPGQWMVLAEQRAETEFAATLRTEVPGSSVTEQTDGWAAFTIAAPDATALEHLAERLVNLPPEALAPGRATRSLLHHMSVYVLRPSGTQLTLLGMRSSAQSLWHALESAAARLAA